MHSRTLAAAAAVCAVAAIAPAAQAATVSYDDSGALVYTGEGAEVNDVIASEGVTSGYIRFHEYAGATIKAPVGPCQPVAGSDGSVECRLPSAMRVDLGAGNDEYTLGFGFPHTLPVAMSGGEGDDLLQDDYAADMGRSLDGGPGNDRLEAYKGADTVIGGPGDDELKGGAGPDAVHGQDGNDTLEGDKYEAPAPDLIEGGPGFDIMEEYSRPGETINPPAKVTQDGVADDGRPGEGDNVTGVEKVTSHVSGVYNGTEGDDDIWIWSNITSGDSTINGLAGNDKLTGLEDSETIDGGAGDDTIQGGMGNDTVVGGPGKDRINSDGGSFCGLYECSVPFGDDTVDARDGEVDQVECGIGNDTVTADGADQVAPSCENVTRGGGPGPGTDPGGPNPTTPAALGFAAPKTRMAALRRGAARFSVTCAAACQVTSGLYKGRTKVAQGSKSLIAARKATVKLKLTAKGKKVLKKAKSAKLELRVSVKDAAGVEQGFQQKLKFR